MIEIVLNYALILGLYIIHPFLGGFYIILSFINLIIKRKKYKTFFLSLILFSFSLYLIVNPINNGEIHYGIVIDTSENYYLFFSEGNTYYIYEKDTIKEIGDILKLKGNIKTFTFNKYEGDFDFTSYLHSKNVFYELKVSDSKNIFLSIFKINWFKSLLIKNFNQETQEFIKMFIYSSGSSLSSLVSELGIFSLLSSSGILIYFLIDFLKRIIFRFVNFKYREYIPYVLVLPILFLTSFKVGVIRSIIIGFNNDILNRKYERNQIYFALLFICIIINPYFFKTSTFIYAFVLPYLIYYLNDSIKTFKRSRQELIRGIFIQLLFLPVIIYFNKQYSIISIIILFFFKEVFGCIYSIIYIIFFIPFIRYFINNVCEFVLFFLNIINKCNMVLYFKDVSIFIVFILYILFFIMIVFFEFKERKKGIITGFLMIAFVICNSSNINSSFISYVSFIDVGQGDAILIHDKNIDVLIDTGGAIHKDIALDVLIPYFKKCGIKDIDYVFISHDDYDHNGAFESLNSNFLVKNYVTGSNFTNIKVGNLVFENLNFYDDFNNKNDSSSVIKLDFYSTTYLFTGDISSNVEKKLILEKDIKSDILKIAHHGSLTSSSYEFLRKVNPKIAVISVGENNYYNHPSDIVIERLKSLNIKIYRTDIDGTITFYKYI